MKKRPEIPLLCVGVKDLALAMGLSTRSIKTYVAEKLMPAPIKIGGRTMWYIPIIRRWLAAGAPPVGVADDTLLTEQAR